MNFPRLFIKDKHPLIDFAYYGSKARRAAHPDVLLGGYTECPMFREGDILDANAVLNLVKCVRWNEWASQEKLEQHIEDTVIHVTQEDKDRWDNNSFVLSDWNELDDTSYAYIKNKPDVYTKDEVYTKTIIDLMLATKADTSSLSNVATSGDYNDLTNKPTIPTIPTNISAFVNDAGYLTEHQDISGKLDVISDLDTIRSGAQAGSTALQPSALNDYYNKTQVDNKLSGKQDTINDLDTIRTGAGLGATALQPSALNDYYNKDQVDTKLSSKQDTISNLATIESGAAKGATAYQLPVTGIPSSDLSSTVLASLGKADTALQEHQDISGKVDTADVGVANGIALLDANGKVPSAQLPSYVDDVLEYAGISQFPQTGESGKIYVDTVTNKTYRWGGSDYREISESLALGETASTAYAGDKGKAVTDNFNTHAADTTIHITASERTAWNAKADKSYVDNDFLKNYIEEEILPEHDYVEIGGVKWATMNVGANSITDIGLYFQWADTQGYTASQVGSSEGQKQFTWADYKYCDGTSSVMTKYSHSDDKTVIEASDDAVTVNWGNGWRMATNAEMIDLLDATTQQFVTNYQGSGVNGVLLTSKDDGNITLFFPACGTASSGSMKKVGELSYFWLSSLYSNNERTDGGSFFGYSGDATATYRGRYVGSPVRGIYIGPDTQRISVSGATNAEKTAWNNKVDTTDLATVATSGDYNDLSNKPTIPVAQVQADWNQATTTEPDYIKNKPTIPTVPTNVSAFTNDAGYLTQHQDISGKANIADLATVATSGSYTDLSNTPSIPAAQVNSDWSASSGVAQILNKPTLSTVATSGSYADLSNKPTIPSIWTGTQVLYDAITTKDPDTIYIITSTS